MIYDPSTTYTITFLRGLSPSELQMLFKEAKMVSNNVRGSKLIKKITIDISSIRLLLNGFDSVYNEAHE